MKFKGFEGTNKELSDFVKNSNMDFSDIFNVKDNSKGINIILGSSIGIYILAMIVFSYISDVLKPLVKTVMFICTIGVPIVFDLKYKKKAGTIFVLISCVILTALILGVADYNEIYKMGKVATDKYIEKQLN